MKKLLILGCGWVGEEFARRQLNKDWEVWATTTSEEKYHRLKSDGIFAYIHDFDSGEPLNAQEFPEFDAVLCSIPATQKNSLEALQIRFTNVNSLLNELVYRKLLFLSSIGIFPDVDGIYDENFQQEDLMNPKLLLAEQLMLSLPHAHVMRLGGLFGKQRIFAKYFQNRICSTGDQPANFIHLDDVCNLLERAFEANLPKPVYHLVAPEHPRKKEVILASAAKYALDPPAAFEPQDNFQKIVKGDKIAQLLNYRFEFPSPLEF